MLSRKRRNTAGTPTKEKRRRYFRDTPGKGDTETIETPEKVVLPRDAAIKAYARWLRKPGRVEPLVAWAFDRYTWDQRDKAFFLELLYGVIRQHGRLEWLISKLSRRGVNCDYIGKAAAILGLYQELFLDRIPIHAVVDTAVAIARKAEGAEVGGWVNAILRRVDREHELWMNLLPEPKEIERYLAVKHSHPPWLVNKLIKTYGNHKAEQILEWNNRRPKVTVRVNRLRAIPEAIIKILKDSGIGVTTSSLDDYFLVLDHAGDIAALSIFTDGSISMQDASQGLVAGIVSPDIDEKILDMCSAPGGKTGHIAELCPKCQIIATDKSDERLKDTRDMVARQGYENVIIMSYQEVLSARTRYNGILIDAPCSGTGVMARRPDIRWRLKPDDIARHASTQRQLLRYAAERLDNNGRIIYSTCSILPEENDAVVDDFLSEHRNFQEVPLDAFVPPSISLTGGRLSVLGPEADGDGVFVARILAKL